MFGSVMMIIDFNRINFVKLILDKIDFKLKWFIFGQSIQKKLNKKFECKN
jgi:hypothetical protein